MTDVNGLSQNKTLLPFVGVSALWFAVGALLGLFLFNWDLSSFGIFVLLLVLCISNLFFLYRLCLALLKKQPTAWSWGLFKILALSAICGALFSFSQESRSALMLGVGSLLGIPILGGSAGAFFWRQEHA